MAENKIPVLTEVYKPKKDAKTSKSVEAPLQVTPELIAKVTAQVRTELEAEVAGPILDELRAEIKVLREEIATSTQDRLDENTSDDSVDLASELAQKVTSQVKPRLEAEITDFALDELRSEIKKAREEVISTTKDFVDKAKADLKTEMPMMYQHSIDLAQVDLTEKFATLQSEASAKVDASLASVSEATTQITTLQTQLIGQHQSELDESFNALHKTVSESTQSALRDELGKIQDKAVQDHQTQLNEALDGFLQIKGEHAEKTLMQQIQAHQEKIRANYQEQLTEQMTDALQSIKERVEESTEEQIGIMHSQVGIIQQETFAKLREDFSAEKAAALSEAASEIKVAFLDQMTAESQEISDQFLAKVNGDLPAVQEILQENIQSILANAIPDLESRLSDQLTAELQQLLLKVKFVLPE